MVLFGATPTPEDQQPHHGIVPGEADPNLEATEASNNNNNKKKTMEDYIVRGLEAVEPAYAEFNGTMYAGTIPIHYTDDETGRNVIGETMFWLFQPDTQSVPDTLTLWLNGGPGCSSFNCGVMMEHSPVTQPLHDAGYCCLQTTPTLYANANAWTRATTMLYVEHPIGTGFSFGSPLPETEREASADLWQFIMNFYDIFEPFRNLRFFVFGESYAGMFVPSVTKYFHDQNQKHDDKNKQVNLGGAAIGNGWMDPVVQGPATIDYSWWHGLIDEPTRNALHNEWKNCMAGIPGNMPPFHTLNIQDDCGIMWGILQAAGNPNAYDVTTWDPNVDQVTFTSEGFYNTLAVKHALHAPLNITWHGCRWGAGRRRLKEDSRQHRHRRRRRLYMDNDRPWSVVPYVAELVDAGIPVLVYNGDRDMTTNMVGTERLLNDMEWTGSDDWLDAPRGVWMIGGKTAPNGNQAGWAKEHLNLTYVVVYNSGHMVPYNRPVPAFDLLSRFLTGQSFIDIESPQIRVADKTIKEKNDDRHHHHGHHHDDENSVGIKPEVSSMLGASRLQTASLLPAPISATNHQFNLTHVAAIAMGSLVLGVLLTLLTLRRTGKSSSRRHQYQVIPEAAAAAAEEVEKLALINNKRESG